MSYLVWKLIHIVSVVLFLGNIITGLFWAAHAHRSRKFELIESAFNGIIKSDRWFTVPGVVGITASGIAAAIKGSFPILGTGWILWPIILFSISGIVFGIWVAPLQRAIAKLVKDSTLQEANWEEYSRLYKRWEIWGLVAVVAPIAALIIMVLKPALPGL